MEVGFKCELVLKSVGFVRQSSNFPRLVVEHQEETGVNVVFVEVNTFQFVPEVPLVANEVPAQFFLVEVEVCQVFFIPAFHGLEIFFGLHFLFLREGQDARDFCRLIIKGAVELSAGVLVLKLVCVSEQLDVDDGADIDLFKLKV